MNLSKAQIKVLANLDAGCGLVTSESFGNTFWSSKAESPEEDFILPATARKLHALGLIARRTGRGYTEWDAPNTFITDAGREQLQNVLDPSVPKQENGSGAQSLSR